MNELIKSVGLSGVTPENQSVKLTVNQLTGMSTELASAVTKNGDTVALLWANIQAVALERLVTGLEIALSKQANFRHVVCSTEPPRPSVSPLPISPSAHYVGQALSSPYSGRHAALRIETVECLSQTTGASTLKIFDLLSRTEIHTETIDIVDGYNSFAVNKSFSVNWRGADLFIGIDATAITLRELEFGCDPDEIQTAPVMLGIGALKSRSSLIDAPGSLYVAASLVCDIRSVADRFVDQLAWAFAYQCAALLLDEKLASPKINLFTNTNRMDTEDRITEYKNESRNRITQAAKLIYHQLNGSVCLCSTPEDQPGVYMGSYVTD